MLENNLTLIYNYSYFKTGDTKYSTWKKSLPVGYCCS